MTRIASAMLKAGSTLPASPLMGSTDSYKMGSKKRRLDPVQLAIFQNNSATNAANNFKLKLKGLSDDLSILVACGLSAGQDALIFPAQYPASPGTIQVYPKTNVQGYPVLLREVFQDPTATDNKNHPLPQDLPYGWSFSPEGVDEAIIEVVIPQNVYTNANIPTNTILLVEVTIEYVGAALDVSNGNNRQLAEWVMGQVQLSNITPITYLAT